MKSEEKVILKRTGDIGLIQINNPPENYLEKPDFIELEALKRFVDTDIKALVIEGAGRHFSAGADLDTLKVQIKNQKAFKDQLINGNTLLDYIDALEIPVIAAITGICFGAGLEMALVANIRIAEENALFAFPEVHHGLFPGLKGTVRMAELTDLSTALELVLQGDMINAGKAQELGIIDKVVSKRQASFQAIELAQKMTNNRPLRVIRAVMQSVKNHKTMNADTHIKNDTEMFVKLVLEAMKNKTD